MTPAESYLETIYCQNYWNSIWNIDINSGISKRAYFQTSQHLQQSFNAQVLQMAGNVKTAMCKHHLNTVENIYKNTHPWMNVYTYRVAYVEMYSAFERFIKCIFCRFKCGFLCTILTPFCVHSHCGRGKFKVVLAFPLHSARGGLHHRLVTGMTESGRQAGGRAGGGVIDSPAGAQRCGGASASRRNKSARNAETKQAQKSRPWTLNSAPSPSSSSSASQCHWWQPAPLACS